jgi:hypothetical protein
VDVSSLGLFTVGAPMPSGPITFAAQVTVPADPQGETGAVYTSDVIRLNTGAVVPDGTSFTVYSLAAGATTFAPLGTITTGDVDANATGVQVRSVAGVIRFAATYPAGVRGPQVLAFATRGTAVGSQIIDLRPQP